jgi:hypothetical protein
MSHTRNCYQLFLFRIHSLETMVYSTEQSEFVIKSHTKNSPYKKCHHKFQTKFPAVDLPREEEKMNYTGRRRIRRSMFSCLTAHQTHAYPYPSVPFPHTSVPVLLFICPHVPACVCPPTSCMPDSLPSHPYIGMPTATER